jgi:hypothetical protein
MGQQIAPANWESRQTSAFVNSVCFSPDSRWLVSASWDKTIRMWDCGTGQAIGSPLLGHTNEVTSVCTDGQRIISGAKMRPSAFGVVIHMNSLGRRSMLAELFGCCCFQRWSHCCRSGSTMYVSLILRLDSK